VGSSIKTNKNKRTEFVFKTKSRMDMTLALEKSQIKENLSSSINIEELERKIDSITEGLSRPYFNKILKELAKKNLGG
jgi:hypothetical protein